MSIRKISALVGAAAMVAAGFALSTPGTAHADPALVNGAFPAPAAKDIVAVGSDTTQLLVGALGTYYNSNVVGTATDKGAGAKIVSYDACTLPAGKYYPCASPTTGTTDNSNTTNRIRLANNGSTQVFIDRPNGSGAGRNALGAGGANNDKPGVAIARSSGALDDAGVAAHLEAFPFAVDTLKMVSSATTHLPSNLTWTQIKGIYNGTYKTIGDIAPSSTYKNERIHAYFPQSGSGTMQFFMQQLDPAGSKNTGAWSAGGSQCEWNSATNSYYTCSSTENVNKQVQEHDPSFIKSDPDAIAPFSLGRMTLINNQTPNTIKAIGLDASNKSYQVQRAVYNVVRTQNNAPSGSSDNPAWFAGSTLMKSLLAPWNPTTNTGGFFCSPAAKGTIEAQGFLQLKSGAGEPCGVGIVTTNAPSNLDANTAGKMTSKVGGTIAATNYAAAHTLTVKVLGQSGVVPTGTVTVVVNKKTYTPKLDATGTAKVSIPTTTNAGTYTATLKYAGNINFNASSGSVKVVINKLATTITHSAPATVKTGSTFSAVTYVHASSKVSGSVGLYKGTTRIAVATLVSGKGTLKLTAAGVKSHLPLNKKTSLKIVYPTTTNFKASSDWVVVTRK